jgi:hypothetical protein
METLKDFKENKDNFKKKVKNIVNTQTNSSMGGCLADDALEGLAEDVFQAVFFADEEVS